MICTRCYRRYAGDAGTTCARDGAPLTDSARSIRVKLASNDRAGELVGGRFRVVGLLGEGGMARVYLADDTTTGERVAVKILKPERARDKVACERFLREARAAASIGHPNIIATVGVGDVERDPYLVLEFLFGESLSGLLARDGVVDLAFGVPLIKQAAQALEAAHATKIIHRDIKPDNLFLVGERGDPYELKVLDFGFAKLTEGSLTQTGTAVGTVPYMAPEQMMVDPLDGRVDQYALGVVMYKTFTGRLPFLHDDDADLLAHHLIVPPPRPSDLVPGFDPRLEAVILRLLRKVPDNRYPSMGVLVEDLERLVGARRGGLVATAPPAERDVFVPRGPLGKNAAPFFYKRLGLVAPWRAS